MRLTANVRQRILDQNEGYRYLTYYSDRNNSETRIYTVEDGKLFIESKGKTSWADSRYSDKREATNDETHRYLYNYISTFNTDGIE
ncbi:hypothetical protein MXZ23_00590 [Streptococcus uberis]|uniref:hypothetical protein n=1 Tax=Streptococcus uberis TaxID=1349 RepID=UPI000AE59657|nr:hypothetical protein [Streptococcus uberis]MCK1192127.1 hypothetical protein [Streptococcus uberis]MTB43251.1 hypothetical protein [Streptococcus uberis]QBX11976.1 hypothetical protein JavanS622_0002 [Streptococcus satellite phage Javan622]